MRTPDLVLVDRLALARLRDFLDTLASLRADHPTWFQDADSVASAEVLLELDRALRDPLRRPRAQMRARYDLRAVLATDDPWPLSDVLERLAGAVEHLQQVHDCDRHGYENDQHCAQRARRLARLARATGERLYEEEDET